MKKVQFSEQQHEDEMQHEEEMQHEGEILLKDDVQLENKEVQFSEERLESEIHCDEEFADASASFDDIKIDDNGMQFDDHSSDFDGTAEQSSKELEKGGLPRRAGLEEEADSGSDYGHDDPLYAGAAITVGVAMTLIMAFIVRHKLTNEAISDLLFLIDHICPKPKRCCKLCTNLKKFFSFLVIPFNCCYYCSKCFNSISDTTVRACSVCKAVINSVKGLSNFIHLPISEQIRSLFARKFLHPTYFINLN